MQLTDAEGLNDKLSDSITALTESVSQVAAVVADR